MRKTKFWNTSDTDGRSDRRFVYVHIFHMLVKSCDHFDRSFWSHDLTKIAFTIDRLYSDWGQFSDFRSKQLFKIFVLGMVRLKKNKCF